MDIQDLRKFEIIFNKIDVDVRKIRKEIYKQKNERAECWYDRFSINKSGISILSKYELDEPEDIEFHINFKTYLKWKDGEKINWLEENI